MKTFHLAGFLYFYYSQMIRLAIYRFLGVSLICIGIQTNQQIMAQNSNPEVVLHLRETLISGNAVKIGYEIPFDGYIEFYLFSKEGERIWYSSYVKEKGSHYLALSRTKMESGTLYLFDFWYKGKKYSGSFTNS